MQCFMLCVAWGRLSVSGSVVDALKQDSAVVSLYGVTDLLLHYVIGQ